MEARMKSLSFLLPKPSVVLFFLFVSVYISSDKEMKIRILSLKIIFII